MALKVLPAGVTADRRATARFMREAQAAGQLNHESIVRVYATGVREGTPWYSMEFVEGETLAQILAKIKDSELETETPFGPKDDIRYFGQLAAAFADVADGLQHAHSKGVTHRDIKPSNLILDVEGRLRILDFGLARLEGQESLTISGDLVGTPLYMSPEQARQRKIKVDHRTDVYSLGATMYEVLCGRPPFKGKDHQDTLSQIVERDPVEPRKVNPRVPRELETIVLKCLRKDATDRYGTAEALGQDLQRFVRGDAIEARPRSRLEVQLRRLWRNRWRMVAAAFVCIFIAVATLFLQSRGLRERERDRAVYDKDVGDAALAIEAFTCTASLSRGSLSLVDPYGTLDTEFKYFLPGLFVQRKDDSITSLLQSLTRDARLVPERPEAHYFKAKALALVDRDLEATAELQLALEKDPTSQVVLDPAWPENPKTFGPGRANSAQQTSDAGYIVAGDSSITKIDSVGNLDPAWNPNPRQVDSVINSVHQTSDGGYIAAGSTKSLGAGESDVWLLKLDSEGNLDPAWGTEWPDNPKTLGGPGDDRAGFVQQTSDGGYVAAGSNLFKLDAAGHLDPTWDPNPKPWSALFVVEIKGGMGGYVLVGQSERFHPNRSLQDLHIRKLDSDGNLDPAWDPNPRTFWTAFQIDVTAFDLTLDRGFVIATEAYHDDGTPDGAYLHKFDADGTHQWTFFPSPWEGEVVSSVERTSDGGYVVTGWSWLPDRQAYLMKLNSWEVNPSTFGLSSEVRFSYVQETRDRGYIVAGRTFLMKLAPAHRFLRADCNGDGTVDISDAVFTLGSLFLGDGNPGCDDACDSNDDGALDISDAINTLGVLFLGNGVIPLPGMTGCGVDPTEDEVSCDAFEQCP